jgi:UDP-N-acetylmuramoyl-L-alanyl-D-glutamate--2,6-diaminopimelate ligase
MIPKSLKRYYHCLWSVLALCRYGNASKKLVVIGVTGTDGKTTTTTLVHGILAKSGKKVAMLNGLRFVLPSKEWKNHSDNSTPGKGEVHRFLRQAVEEGCEYAIIEVTSWGLDQFRLLGIAFDLAVITNLTYEHLDLHGNMQGYKQAKGRLFSMLKSARKPGQAKVAVVNQDDDSAEFFAAYPSDKVIRFGLKAGADVSASEVKDEKELTFVLKNPTGEMLVSMALKGSFNVYNALAAAAVATALEIDLPTIATGLASVKAVPGRMETIELGQPFHVIVDFAHTPNGFRALFIAARRLVGENNRVIAVYGATGGRDRGRRPMVGELAAEFVDFSVLTSEDPRNEDPEMIAKEIEIGLHKKGAQKEKDYLFIKDRAEAISYAIKLAQPGDAVLLCSMGDYDVMYVGDGKVPWSDREAAKKSLKELLR